MSVFKPKRARSGEGNVGRWTAERPDRTATPRVLSFPGAEALLPPVEARAEDGQPKRATPVDVERQAAAPVSCVDCSWSGRTDEMKDMACPECKGERIVRL